MRSPSATALLATAATAMLAVLATPAAGQTSRPTPQASQTSQAPPHQTVSGPTVALTGDQVVVSGASIRLFGIAAPLPGETCLTRYGVSYDCYRRATDVLQALIDGGPVSCSITATDRNGQRIGVCRSNGTDLAAAMVARGWAFAYRRLTPAYIGAETFAESHRLGMWAGKVETPWQWRSRQLSDTAH